MKYKITFELFILLQICICFVLYSCKQLNKDGISNDEAKGEVEGNYMNMVPTKTPRLLSSELLASSLQEYNGTFNPEGTEFFFTTNTPSKGIICYTKIGKDNNWIKPKVAEFSGVYSEYDPIFSPDGSKLYFTSERPNPTKDGNTQTNIWYVEKKGDNWTNPVYVDLNGHGNYYSSITNEGTIYYNIWDTGDMYKATLIKDGYEIEKLSSKLNTKNGEGDPFISPEEDYIIYRGYNNSLGNGDLYISYLINNEWTEPENLEATINSKYHEMCPYVTLDGKFFIFSSSRIEEEYKSDKNSELKEIRTKHKTHDNGELNIYYVSTDFIKERRAKHIENK